VEPKESGRIVEILLVEDNPADVTFVQAGLASARLQHRLTIARDGEQALELLERRGKYASCPAPELVLLDLNLPKKSGMEILSYIRTSSSLRRIPVIIYSSSSAQKDVNLAYECGANAYVQKPRRLDDIYNIGRAIENFWLKLTLLPDAY
jgi:chemotaxis family two-component system response regulator Rcp1